MTSAKLVVEQVNPNLVTEVFEYKLVVGNAPGAKGDSGTTDISILTAKPIPADTDLALIADSTANFLGKKITFAEIWTWIKSLADLVYQVLFNIKNWGTIVGPTTLNATNYSTQTADFTASFTATFEGFTTSRQSIAFEFVVASGTPTVTLAGSIFKFYTTLNLSALAPGSYVAYFKSSDSGTNTKVFVKLAP